MLLLPSAASSAVCPPVSIPFPLPPNLAPSSSAAVPVSFESLGVALPPGGSAAPAVPASFAVCAAPVVPVLCPLFPPFGASASAATPGAPGWSSVPSFGAAPLRVPPPAPPGLLPGLFGAFSVAPDAMPEDNSPDAVPRDPDPAFSAGVSESFSSEFHRMLSFIVDLFPQAAGSPSVAPPSRALFEDFFAPTALPQQPIFLNWFERVRAALVDGDSRMAASIAAGRSNFSFYPFVFPNVRSSWRLCPR